MKIEKPDDEKGNAKQSLNFNVEMLILNLFYRIKAWSNAQICFSLKKKLLSQNLCVYSDTCWEESGSFLHDKNIVIIFYLKFIEKHFNQSPLTIIILDI